MAEKDDGKPVVLITINKKKMDGLGGSFCTALSCSSFDEMISKLEELRIHIDGFFETNPPKTITPKTEN